MTMHKTALVSLFAASLCSAGTLVDDGDVIIGLDPAGNIQTGSQLPDMTIGFGVRVFKSRLDVDGFPNLGEEPGFQSLGGAFPPGTQIGFDIEGGLLEWDGAAFTSLDPVHRLVLTNALGTAETGFDNSPVPGYVIGSANPSGEFHEHLRFFLDPYDAVNQDEGLWLLSMSLWSENPVVLPSETFYIVFAAGSSFVAQQETAVDWVQQNLVQPGCNAADFTQPFGILDLADLVAFVTAFTAQDPIADIQPDGLFDLADITAYVNAFTTGCP